MRTSSQACSFAASMAGAWRDRNLDGGAGARKLERIQQSRQRQLVRDQRSHIDEAVTQEIPRRSNIGPPIVERALPMSTSS